MKSIIETIGNTPLVDVSSLGSGRNTILAKMEGNNPAGSVKDRPAYNMIISAQERGTIKPGDHLIEATSGNTGIALAMVAAALDYRITLLMPSNQTEERKQAMRAYGANLILIEGDNGMETARDTAQRMGNNNEGHVLNQFANPDNPAAHYKTTAPEIWQDTNQSITHFVSSMGTTGTITGCSRYFKQKNPNIQIIGVQPKEGSQIPGIRKWAPEYIPPIYNSTHIDDIRYVSEDQSIDTMKNMAKKAGIFSGVSSGGAMAIALELDTQLQNAVIVSICCDRGDRYLSTGVYQN